MSKRWNSLEARQFDLKMRLCRFERPTLDDLKRCLRESGYKITLYRGHILASAFLREVVRDFKIDLRGSEK